MCTTSVPTEIVLPLVMPRLETLELTAKWRIVHVRDIFTFGKIPDYLTPNLRKLAFRNGVQIEEREMALIEAAGTTHYVP